MSVGRFGKCSCCGGGVCQVGCVVDVEWYFAGSRPFQIPTLPPPTFYLYQTITTDYTWKTGAGCATQHTAQSIMKFGKKHPDKIQFVSLSTSCDGLVYSSELPENTADGVRVEYYNPAIFNASKVCVTPTPCIKCVGGNDPLGNPVPAVAALKWGDPNFMCNPTWVTNRVINSPTVRAYELSFTTFHNPNPTVIGTKVVTLSDPIGFDDLEAETQSILDLFDFAALPITVPANYPESFFYTLTDEPIFASDGFPTGKCCLAITPAGPEIFNGGARLGGRNWLFYRADPWLYNQQLDVICNRQGNAFAARREYQTSGAWAIGDWEDQSIPLDRLYVRMAKGFIRGGAPNCCHILTPQQWGLDPARTNPNTGLPALDFLMCGTSGSAAPAPTCHLASPHDPVETINPPGKPTIGQIYLGSATLPPTCAVPGSCCQ